MGFVEELGLLIRARYPVIYLATAEEERPKPSSPPVPKSREIGRSISGTLSMGYQGNLNDAGYGRRNPLQALELLEKLPASAAAIFVLRDFHRFLDDIAISRKLRNLARSLKSQPKNIIILSSQLTMPEELSETSPF
jgi:hypothetical protein